jgi:hypothetical protein
MSHESEYPAGIAYAQNHKKKICITIEKIVLDYLRNQGIQTSNIVNGLISLLSIKVMVSC